MRITRFGFWLRYATASFLFVFIAACAETASNPAAIVIPCDPMDPGSCPQDEGFAQICSIADNNTCVNVCEGASALPGGCETDGECGQDLTCDNDDARGGSTCECVSGTKDCVPAFMDLGGTTEDPVVWEEKYSCVDDGGNCFAGGASDNNQPITFELVQNGKDIVGMVRTGPGEGDLFGEKQHGRADVLRFADLSRDEELLVEAQRRARAIVERDPDLSQPAHARLRAAVDTRYKDRLEMYEAG